MIFVQWRWLHFFLIVVYHQASGLAEVEAFCTNGGCAAKPVLRVVSHGDEREYFWKTVHGAASEAARDYGAVLHWEWPPQGSDPGVWMKGQIEHIFAPTNDNKPDAVITTIPSQMIAMVLAFALSNSSRVPVFGFNSGYTSAGDLGLVNFFGQHEVKAGEQAGQLMYNDLSTCGGQVSFVDHLAGSNNAITQRWAGFHRAIAQKAAEQNCTTNPVLMQIHPVDRRQRVQTILNATAGGPADPRPCRFSGILTNGVDAANDFHTLLSQKCLDHLSVLGTFDNSQHISQLIASGDMSFSIVQQEWLQGYASVAAAAIYVKTGMRLFPPPDTNKTHMTGPHALTINSTSTTTSCARPCVNRAKIRIAGVHHGVSSNSFWDWVEVGIRNAEFTLDVQLNYSRIQERQAEPNATVNKLKQEEIWEEMKRRLAYFCSGDTAFDAVFVSVPDDSLKPAIRACIDNKISVITINAPFDDSFNSGNTTDSDVDKILHHIGAEEAEMGRAAAQEIFVALQRQGGMTHGVCAIQSGDIGLSSVKTRCNAFKEELQQLDPAINVSTFLDFNDSMALGDEFLLSPGPGLLLNSPPAQLSAAMMLRNQHPNIVVGTFDSTEETSRMVQDGKLHFVIDQQQFLQGHLAVLLLTLNAYAGQHLHHSVLNTGRLFLDPLEFASVSCLEDTFVKCFQEEVLQRNSEPVIPKTNITIGLLFPVEGVSGSLDELQRLAATQLAVQHVNEDPNLLTHFNLQYLALDVTLLRLIAQGDDTYREYFIADQAARINNQLSSAHNPVGVVGASRSSDVAAVSSALQYPLISPSATAAALSNSSRFPRFARTCMPDTEQAVAMAATLKFFRWDRIVIVHCNDMYCRGLANGVKDELEKTNTAVLFQHEFVLSSLPSHSPESVVSEIQRKFQSDCQRADAADETSVVVIIAHDAEQIFAAAASVGLQTNWLASEAIGNTAAAQLTSHAAASTVLALRPGVVITDHYEKLQRDLGGPPTVFTLTSYDAVLSLAHAVSATVAEGEPVDNTSAVLHHLRDVEFQGTSGDVTFNSDLDRLGTYDLVIASSTGVTKLGFWDASVGSIILDSDSFQSLELFRPCSGSDEQEPSKTVIWITIVAISIVLPGLYVWREWARKRRKKATLEKMTRDQERVEWLKSGGCHDPVDPYYADPEESFLNSDFCLLTQEKFHDDASPSSSNMTSENVAVEEGLCDNNGNQHAASDYEHTDIDFGNPGADSHEYYLPEHKHRGTRIVQFDLSDLTSVDHFPQECSHEKH